MEMKQIIRFSVMLLALLLPALASAHDFEVDGIYYKINGNEATVTYRGWYCYSVDNEYSGSVVIPATVTYNQTTYPVTAIDALAFYECTELTSIVISKSVTEIGQEAFKECPGLTSIVVASGNPKYDSRNNCNAIIETASNTLVVGCKNTTIPNSVTAIGNFAFDGCHGLTSIVIPNSVTSIGWYAFESCTGLTSIKIGNSVTEIGYGAFDVCYALTSIVVASGNPRYDSRDNCNAIIETASNTLVVGCKNTTIPNTVTAIGDWAFYFCHGLTSIDIPNSVTSIGYGAFNSCTGLNSINMGNSVTEIGNWAFEKCEKLSSINIPNSLTMIGEGVFAHCGLTSISIPNSVTSIGDYAFLACWRMKSINLGNSVTAIGDSTFSECGGLTSVVIPNSVTSIGNSAFKSCNGLTSVVIPNSVTSIGEWAFGFCRNLTSINIPKSVTFIGNQAFYPCTKVTSIVVERDNPRYDSRNNCNAIIETASNTLIVGCMNTTIPYSVTTIGREALAHCTKLKSINIPNTVTSIDEWAFYGCTGLNSIVIPNSLTEIGHRAFGNCPELLEVYCYIADLSRVSSGWNQFDLDNGDYSPRTLHVLKGMADDYRADPEWYPYFAQIVDDLTPPRPGDINGDYEVNIADINAVIDLILNGSKNPCGDVNGDREITIADVNYLIDLIIHD